MANPPIFVGLKLEVDGRWAVVKSLTKTRCWLLFDGERVATGFTVNRIRRLLSDGTAKHACMQLGFLQRMKKIKPDEDILP